MASDELLKPLGADRGDASASLAKPWIKSLVVKLLAGILALLSGIIVLYLFVLGDPLSGEPHQIVSIEMRRDAPAPEPEPVNPRIQNVPGTEKPKRTAAEVEQASGVSVVRGDGSAAPSSVVIRVPDAAPARLGPSSDRRVMEQSRYGMLPRISDDGKRPADIYARPPDVLPNGVQPQGRIAIVVGGLGISSNATQDAITRLPAPVTLAFAPYGSDLERSVVKARENGHEVMLQVPMEPFDYPDNDPGPHTLTVTGTGQANLDRLHWVMARFPGYVGIVNFMGAKLTSDNGAISAILKEVGKRGLVYLDDGSSSRSLAVSAASSARVPALKADVVIDAAGRADAIDKELARLEEIARKQGIAIGTASALPLTVDRLAKWSRDLEAKGLLLTSLTSLYPPEKR